MKQGDSMLFYVIETCLYFAVNLAILQLGVRTFVAELTNSFQGMLINYYQVQFQV